MNKKIEERHERWRQLEETGIPLEPKQHRVGFYPEYAEEFITITQTDGELCNTVSPCFRERGGTALTLSVEIISKRRIVIRSWDLKFLWDPSSELIILSDPKNRKSWAKCYVLPNGDEFTRDLVLNHRLEVGCVLQRGSLIKGLLLGYSLSSMRSEFRHGKIVGVEMTLFDTSGRAHRQELIAMVCRDPALSVKPSRKKSDLVRVA